MKVGMSLDGKIATSKKESKWITSEQSRKIVHMIRDEVDAIMVGIGTVLEDNPTLSIKNLSKKKKGPARIIVDSTLKIPLNANILEDVTNRRTIILATEHADADKIKQLEGKGVTVLIVPEKNKRVDLKKAALALGKEGITSLMLEGGGDLNFSALQEGILDKVLFFIAPRIIGGQTAISSVGGCGIDKLKDSFSVKDLVLSRVGNDILVEGYLPVKWRKNI
jgi:diaminohydroxyphosphoribosylaminopyrimidine deaminase/5-amino-6-(5-phosphoribosylamino)uracil reductase